MAVFSVELNQGTNKTIERVDSNQLKLLRTFSTSEQSCYADGELSLCFEKVPQRSARKWTQNRFGEVCERSKRFAVRCNSAAEEQLQFGC